MSSKTEIHIIPPIKIDLSVRKRKKGFNHRHQLERPAEDSFELPEKCTKHNNKRFNCMSIDFEDVKDFRDRLFKSNEKRDQREFLAEFIKTIPPKRRTESSLQVIRVMQVYYSVLRKNGDEVPVCRDMFFSVTGLGRSRVKTIVEKIYKARLLQNGDPDDNNTNKTSRKKAETKKRESLVNCLVKEKKEKLLRLEKGTYDVFANAINRRNPEENCEENLEEWIESTETHDQSCEEDLEYMEVERLDDEEFDVDFVSRVNLNLEVFEVCRICLQNEVKLLPLFDCLESEEKSFAEMVELGMSLKLPDDESLPDKICEFCIDRVKSACSLKNDIDSSHQIIINSLDENTALLASSPKENDETNEDFLSQNYFPDMEEESSEVVDFSVECLRDAVNEEEQFDFKNITEMKPECCYLCKLEGNLCDFTEEDAETHFQLNHSEISLTKCTLCDFEIEFPWYLNLHYQIHTKNIKQCSHCAKVFDAKKFKIHKSYCGKSSFPKIHKCEFCESSYKRLFDLKVHQRVHTNERPYVCEVCNMNFAKRIVLRRHLLVVHSMGAKVFCSKCQKGYLQKYELSRHEKFCNKRDS